MNSNVKCETIDIVSEAQAIKNIEYNTQNYSEIKFQELKTYFRGTTLSSKKQEEAIDVITSVLLLFDNGILSETGTLIYIKKIQPQFVLNILKFLFDIGAIDKAPYRCRKRCIATRKRFFAFFQKKYPDQSYQDAIKLKRMLYTDYCRDYFWLFNELMHEWNGKQKSQIC